MKEVDGWPPNPVPVLHIRYSLRQTEMFVRLLSMIFETRNYERLKPQKAEDVRILGRANE